MVDKENITRNLLLDAQNSISLASTFSLLQQAEKEARDWINSEGSSQSYKVLSLILSELAQVSSDPKRRNDLWQEALSVLAEGLRKTGDPKLALEFGWRTIDYIEDEFASRSEYDLRKTLSDAKSILDKNIGKEANHTIRGELLSCKSAILRFSALQCINRREAKKIAEEAYRCAIKAVKEGGRIGGIVLQEGLSLWFLSRFADNDYEYNTQLQNAEECFWLSVKTGNKIHGLLTLSRFFRQTYRPMPCCDAFTQYLTVETQKRRAWRSSYIYGEAVIQLWYSKYPSQLFDEHSKEAIILLEQAIDAGYRTARNVVALAFLKACKGEKAGGESCLGQLFQERGVVSWQKALEIVKQTHASGDYTVDLVAKGFALGIDNGAVWNKLGTFALTFLEDWQLAENLYREAIKLSPKDPISLTNLARLLIIKDGEAEKAEARLLLAKAATYSDLRFKWWRVVRALLEPQEIKEIPYQRAKVEFDSLPPAHSFKDIRKQFRILKRMEDEQKRSKNFEKLFVSLMNITLGNARGPYKLETKREVDVAIYFDKEGYTGELKWQKKPIGPKEINDFAIDKLYIPDIWGLFISMSGFTSGAIEAAKRRCYQEKKKILLIDGEEMEFIIEHYIPFDLLLGIKRMYLFIDGNPYYKVSIEDVKQNI